MEIRNKSRIAITALLTSLALVSGVAKADKLDDIKKSRHGTHCGI